MIINIRGTSGSGKSTLARSIRDLYTGPKLTYHEPGRKQPLGYLCHRGAEDPVSGPPLGLVGHYETDCGGSDTITNMDRIFALALQGYQRQLDVIFEGLLISAEVNRTVELFKQCDGRLLIVHLDVPLQECLDSVNHRRREKDLRRWRALHQETEEPNEASFRPSVNPKNTESKHKGTIQACKRLRTAGLEVFTGGRVACYNKIREVLSI